jgi:hypothetical protein
MRCDRRIAKCRGLQQVRTLACPAALAACLVLLAAVHPVSAREKTDVVILKNGDHLTGEIKGLQYARLSFKTDTMETVSVKWEEVAQITSKYSFELELEDGVRFFGSLGAPAQPGMVSVTGKERALELDMGQVVRIRPIKDKFWKRIDGSLSIGLSFTKASDVLRFSFNADATYTERKNMVDLTINSIVTTQNEQDTRENTSLNLRYNRLLENRWFLSAFTGVQRNDELGIRLRVLGGGGGGRLLVQTNRMILPVLAGFSLNQELAASDGQDSFNAEGLFGLYWNLFIHHKPKTDLSLDLTTYPSMTEKGRVRLDLETRLRREIIKDFFVDLSFYLNYDNKPPSVTASTTDYGFVTSVGYSF